MSHMLVNVESLKGMAPRIRTLAAREAAVSAVVPPHDVRCQCFTSLLLYRLEKRSDAYELQSQLAQRSSAKCSLRAWAAQTCRTRQQPGPTRLQQVPRRQQQPMLSISRPRTPLRCDCCVCSAVLGDSLA